MSILLLISIVVHVSSLELLTIEVAYPSKNLPYDAALYLRGDGSGLSWTSGQRMRSERTDNWSITLPMPGNGTTLAFKALINDRIWAVGANAVAAGGVSSVSYYPWFRPGGGRYEVTSISSPTGPRGVVAYLPPSYDENPYAQYDELLVVSDGENIFVRSLALSNR